MSPSWYYNAGSHLVLILQNSNVLLPITTNSKSFTNGSHLAYWNSPNLVLQLSMLGSIKSHIDKMEFSSCWLSTNNKFELGLKSTDAMELWFIGIWFIIAKFFEISYMVIMHVPEAVDELQKEYMHFELGEIPREYMSSSVS